MEQKLRKCIRCGWNWPLIFFRKRESRSKGLEISGPFRQFRTVCKRCESLARDSIKERDREFVKASDMIRHHAKSLHVTVKYLVEVLAWSARHIADDIKYAMTSGSCPYCRRSFSDMPHGLNDMTIDIVDRSKEAFYAVNTRLVCLTCNRKKATTSPEDFAAEQQCWRLCDERPVSTFGPLFAGCSK